VEKQGQALVAVFALTRAPDRRWEGRFADHAVGCPFPEVSRAAFEAARVRIRFTKGEDLREITRAVDRCIEGANAEAAPQP
jgi:hypothetical protein